MTTIRKIVTSKIDGSDANNTTDDEIRPFGEAAIYIDDTGADKPVLAIHDGVRTHLKSKVLEPGVFYGSGDDSGDGLGLDTIKLIPDSELHFNSGNYGNDQYIIVDPTAPDHIHIRAGGTIDNSNAALFLGGENSNVEIQAGENPPVYVRANSNTWMFDVDGTLTLPGEGVIRSIDDTIVLKSFDTAFNVSKGIRIGTNGYVYFELGDDPTYFQIEETSGDASLIARANLNIVADDGDSPKTWKFGTDGSLTIPGDIQSENDVNITVNNQDSSNYTWNFGNTGGLTLPSGTVSIGNPDGVGPEFIVAAADTQTGMIVSGSGLASISWVDTYPTPTSASQLAIDSYGVRLAASADVNNINSWLFGTDASLTFPDSTVQTTAWTGTGTADTGNVTFDDNTIQGNTLGTVGTQITVNSNYLGATSQNSNVFALSKTADTDQVQIGWIIRGSGGGPQTITNKIDGGSYWMFYVASGISTTYPITIESSDYQLGSGAQLILAVDPGDSSVKSWTFDSDGTLTAPGSITVQGQNSKVVTEFGTLGYNNNQGTWGLEATGGFGSVNLTSATIDNETGNVTAQYTASLTNDGRFRLPVSSTANISQLSSAPNNANASLRLTGGNDVEIVSDSQDINHTWTFDNNGGLTLPTGVTNNGRIINDNGISLKVDSSYWTFGTDGSVTFPDATVQTTAYTGLHLLEAYASETYTLPDSFTEDTCRYSIVNNTVNVSSAWFNTSTYTFTPQKAGYWEITASYDVYRNGESSIAIKKNLDIVAAAGSFNAVAQQVTKIIYLNGSTDYINIINVGGAALERAQYDSRSWFQARWVGN